MEKVNNEIILDLATIGKDDLPKSLLRDVITQFKESESIVKEHTDKIKSFKEYIKDLGVGKVIIKGIDTQTELSITSFETKRTSYDTKKMIEDGLDIDGYKIESHSQAVKFTFKKEKLWKVE